MADHRKRKRVLFWLFLLVLIICNITIFSHVRWGPTSLESTVSSTTWMETYKHRNLQLKSTSHVNFLYDNYEAPPPTSMVDLLSWPALLPPQSSTLDDARATFRMRYQRDPPSAFNAWFAYAKQRKCVIDNYDFIDYDFAPFREMMARNGGAKPITLSILKIARRLGSIHFFRFENNRLSISPSLWYSDRLQTHFADFYKIIPRAKISLVHNRLSEPRVLPYSTYSPPAAHNLLTTTLESDTTTETVNLTKRRTPPVKMVERPPVWMDNGTSNSGVEYASKKGFTLMKRYCPDHPLIENYTEQNPRVDHSFFCWGNQLHITEGVVPIIGQSRIQSCYRDIQWASHFTVTDPFMREIDFEQRPPWNEKKNVLFWRGSTTGQQNTMWNWRDNHRIKAWRATRELQAKYPYPIIDYELTAYSQCDTSSCAEMERHLGPPVAHVSRSYHWKYKYLLVLDGNVFADRLPHYLYGGSLVFLASIFQHTFEEWLTPWVHYVPVRPDLSNLEERLRWAWDNDDMARKIAENGRAFAAHYIRKDDMQCWSYRVLIEYADLYEDEPV